MRTKNEVDLRSDVVRLTVSDLTQRAVVSSTWGVRGAEELVALAAMKWAEQALGRIKSDGARNGHTGRGEAVAKLNGIVEDEFRSIYGEGD